MLALAIVGVVVLLAALTMAHRSPIAPPLVRALGALLGLALLAASSFNSVFFYAEPGFKYHVRTIFGEEKMVDTVGYAPHWFGRINAWKNAMSVQAAHGLSDDLRAEFDSSQMSANLGQQSLVFLDQVDALVSATSRFELPSDQDSFLRMARQFRTPDNLLRTELVPAFRETLGATASLMGAEEYFSGGRTEFTSEFQNQMENGVYLVERREVIEKINRAQRSTANASLETQQEFGDDQQVVFKVEKLLNEQGLPIRKSQNFAKFGITVVSARVTDVQPNQRFRERMQQKQDAATARGIAREQRIQEEEQRLLAIAKGEREVAQRQAKARVTQIERTTNAETEKQLAITQANKLKEQAEIEQQTAQVLLEKAKIDAESLRVAAEAEAYARKARLDSDNALQQKLDTEMEIQRMWANAFARRNVPQYVFGGSGGNGGAQGGAPVGSDSEALLLQQLLTMEYAKRLDYDRNVTGR